MKYSILVPSHDLEGKHVAMVRNLLESIDNHSLGADYEIIVRKNGASYVESHNDALLSSRGDHIIVLNDDVVIMDNQWLQKLTDEEKIVSWREGVFDVRKEPVWDFACWSMPRSAYEKIGLFDEAFKDGIGFEDNDYAYRAREAGIEYKIEPIDLVHLGGKTLHDFYGFDEAKRQKNHVTFNIKWPPKQE